MYTDQGRLCLCVSVCLSVHRGIPTLLHGAGCRLIALYTANAYSAEREMSTNACTRSMPGYYHYHYYDHHCDYHQQHYHYHYDNQHHLHHYWQFNS